MSAGRCCGVLVGGLLWAALLCGCAPQSSTTTAPAPVVPAAEGPWNLPGRPPHLLAHYLPWFEVERSAADPTLTWEHWRWAGPGPAHDPTQTVDAHGRRDVAAVAAPLIGPYASWDPQVIRYHLATAKAAGIAGFIVLWYGPGNAIDARLPLLLDEAQRQGMKLAVCYEEKLNFPPYRTPDSRAAVIASATADLRYLLEQYADHPAYLQRAGVPLICQFNYWSAGAIGPNYLLPQEWREVFAALGQPVLYARNNLDLPFHPTVGGAYVWWSDDDWPTRFAQQARELVEAGRLTFFMGMVAPGFDDSGVWGWGAGPRRSRQYGLPVLQRTMDQALAGAPELVQVVTWNDFNEGTGVEPTLEHGYTFLDAIEQWWGSQTGRAVDLADNRAPLMEFLRTCREAQRERLPTGVERWGTVAQ